MDEKQINRFKDIMKYAEQTSYIDAAKDVMFMACLVKNGLTKTDTYEKAYKEITEFSKYLESIGLGVVSPETKDKPFWFMFLDEAKEIGATITKE